jgi:ribosome-binding protein aMBF1 (putative translation factor)
MMSAPFLFESKNILAEDLPDTARSLPLFDQDGAGNMGRRIRVRRTFCGLSRQQLGARLGIDLADIDAYEQSAKRMSCKLLLETAKQLKASHRFFFR